MNLQASFVYNTKSRRIFVPLCSEKLGHILKLELGDHVPDKSFLVCIIGFPRELDHSNICRSIGVCIKVLDVVIVTEYCPKASLMDVLLSDIPFNWGFQ